MNYPVPMFNDATIEVWEWISYFMTHFIWCMITSLLTPVAHDTRFIKCVPWHSPECNFTHVTDQVHEHCLWNYFQVNATESLWWELNSGSANELVSSGTNYFLIIWATVDPDLCRNNDRIVPAEPTKHLQFALNVLWGYCDILNLTINTNRVK